MKNCRRTGTNRTVRVTPPVDAYGRDLLTFTLSDGTNAMSKSALLTVTGVNDMPSFSLGTSEVRVPLNAGLLSTQVIASASSGPDNELGQTRSYVISTTVPEAFSTQPLLSAGGVLTFKPKAGATNRVPLEVRVQDNGGTANGGQNRSPAQELMLQLGQ